MALVGRLINSIRGLLRQTIECPLKMSRHLDVSNMSYSFSYGIFYSIPEQHLCFFFNVHVLLISSRIVRKNI